MIDEGDSEFDKIISSNNMSDVPLDESMMFTTDELLQGASTIAEVNMYLADFLLEYFSSVRKGDELPGFDQEAAFFLRGTFAAAQNFLGEVTLFLDDDDDEEQQ